MSRPVEVHADGRAPGHRPDRTLRLRVELERQLRRRRTQLAIGFLAVLPGILAAAFAIGGADAGSGASIVELATRSAVNFTTFTLLMSVGFLLVVVVALFFGDAVASEASWSSLRYLLTIPVSRARLLVQKMVVSALLSVVALVVLVVVALTLGLVLYGGGPLENPFGDALPFDTAVARLFLSLGYIAMNLIWVAGLAMLLSVCTDAPLGAVGGTVMVAILVQILDQITALGRLRDLLPGHFSNAWTRTLVPAIDWHDMVVGSFSAVAYGSAFVVAAWLLFARKDITS